MQLQLPRMDSFRTVLLFWLIPFITILGKHVFNINATIIKLTLKSFICNNYRHLDFDISLIAFVHPNVSSSRPLLTQMGFQVIVAPTPINTSAIRYEFLRTKVRLKNLFFICFFFRIGRMKKSLLRLYFIAID